MDMDKPRKGTTNSTFSNMGNVKEHVKEHVKIKDRLKNEKFCRRDKF